MVDAELLCGKNDTIKSALIKINKNCKGVVFVVGEDDVLEGIITDGDIRRGLLAGVSLDDMATKVVNDNYVFAYDNENMLDVFKRFDFAIKIIPIVNQNKQVVDYSEYRGEMRLPIVQPQLNGRELENLLDAFMSTWISSTGRYVDMFESTFADYCGVKEGVATSNGTTALHLALIALGIGVGDEVIVPDFTFAATINAVLYTGATPVIVDVERDSWCIDPKEIEKAITKRTRAIIPVHIYGQVCNMERIMELSRKYNLYVVEDCAEAHGAEFKGQKVGSFGDIGCFSFFGNKVITTGEGGMCVTDKEELAKKMRLHRDHGMSKKRRYYHEVIGYNYRMTNLQAAIGVAQLETIDRNLLWRENLENQYRTKLKQLKHIKFQENDLPNRKKIVWLVSVLADREELKERYVNALIEHNIEVRTFFIPLSEMDLYKNYVFSNKVSSDISKRGFNLPTSYLVGDAEIERVYDALFSVNE